MLRDIDIWFESKPEPAKGCLLALRAHLQQLHPNIREAWKYRMPFYCYNGKMCCYLWTDPSSQHPYIGIVEGKQIHHPLLQTGKRARMKILPINPNEDLPMNIIDDILDKMVQWYVAEKK